ncbi:unnamed protein product, partial [Durusdinium trenchii]
VPRCPGHQKGLFCLIDPQESLHVAALELMWPLIAKPHLSPLVILEDPLIDRAFKWLSICFVPFLLAYIVLSTSPTTFEPVHTDVYQIDQSEMAFKGHKDQYNFTQHRPDYCTAPQNFSCDWYSHEVNASGCSALRHSPYFNYPMTDAEGHGIFIPTMLGWKTVRLSCGDAGCTREESTESHQVYLPYAADFGRLMLKARPHLPDWEWKGVNGPLCLFEDSGHQGTPLQRAHQLGTTECLLQFSYNNSMVRLNSAHVYSGEWGEIFISIPALFNFSERFGELPLSSATRDRDASGKQFTAERCAPRSRGGRFQVRVSTEEALAFPEFLGMRIPIEMSKSPVCWFGSPWLEKFVHHDIWHWFQLVDAGHHWRCWRLRVHIVYDPLFFHHQRITREADHIGGVAVFEERKDAGFAFLLESKTGTVRRFNFGVFVLALTALTWLVSMPRLICEIMAVASKWVPGRDVYRAVLYRTFNIRNEIVAWMVRSLEAANTLRRISQKDGNTESVEIGAIIDELRKAFRNHQEAEDVIEHLSNFLLQTMEKKELADWVRQVQKTEVVNTTRLAEWDQDAFQSVKEIWRNVRTKSFQCVGEEGSESEVDTSMDTGGSEQPQGAHRRVWQLLETDSGPP